MEKLTSQEGGAQKRWADPVSKQRQTPLTSLSANVKPITLADAVFRDTIPKYGGWLRCIAVDWIEIEIIDLGVR